MMERLKKNYLRNREKLLFVLGILIVSLIALPYLMLGEGSYVQVHDQVDGEILNYIYQAKYLFQGDTIPEFMNGMEKASMLPPAPFGVLFYKFLPPFCAFALMHWVCLVTGFSGMFLLCRSCKMRGEVCFVTACIFCYIPFYPVYGLASLGQPMLMWAFLKLAAGCEKRLAAEGDFATIEDEPTAGRMSVTDRSDLTAGGKRATIVGRMVLPLLCIIFYAGMSSLTLIGYVWVVLGFLSALLLLVLRRKPEAIRVGIGTAALTIVYLVTNLDLFGSLFGRGFETHRSEMVLNATENLWEKAKELLFSGGSYSPVYSAGILVAAVLFLCIGCVVLWKDRRKMSTGREEAVIGEVGETAGKEGTFGRKEEVYGKEKSFGNGKEVFEIGEQASEKEKEISEMEAQDGKFEMQSLAVCMKTVSGLLAVILTGVVLAVLWNCQWVTEIRKAIGGMVVYFQADRIYWTFPFVWMFLMGWVMEGLCVWGERRAGLKVMRYLAFGLCSMLVLIEGLQVFRDNTLNKNLRLVLMPEYEQITWESIYMEDVFDRIDEAVGEEKDSVSVVSLGLYPSVALYNGYTCADGYSNNYDLEYKHVFRKIIADELEKNQEAKAYFDDWGNRLYLTAQPYGINGMISKGPDNAYRDVEFDTEAMKALNIGYLFAAAPVEFGAESADDFVLVEGSPFADEDSYYEVWVYQLR